MMDSLTDLLTSPRGQLMLSYVSPIYSNSRVMQSLYQAEGAEFDALRDAITQVLNQFYVDTATWGLDQWESELALAPNPSLTDDERRYRIKSKIRGYGTATISLVKTVAEAYDRGKVDVIEDFAAYTIHIWFVDTRGVPANIDDLKAALRAVVPAHLDIQYTYHYLIWDEFDAKGWTWDQFDAQGYTWDELEVAT
jgi:hypothetical protein